MRGEGLHAKVDAADAHRRHGGDPLHIEAPRIEFDGNRRLMRIKTEKQLLEQADEIDKWQRIGTAAAKGDARHPATSAQTCCDKGDLPLQGLDISGQAVRAVRRAGVAAAIPAYVVAIG